MTWWFEDLCPHNLHGWIFVNFVRFLLLIPTLNFRSCFNLGPWRILKEGYRNSIAPPVLGNNFAYFTTLLHVCIFGGSKNSQTVAACNTRTFISHEMHCAKHELDVFFYSNLFGSLIVALFCEKVSHGLLGKLWIKCNNATSRLCQLYSPSYPKYMQILHKANFLRRTTTLNYQSIQAL